MLEQPLMNRAQVPGSATDPVGKCRTVKIDPLSLVDLRLPVEWQVVGIFGDQHLGDGRLGRKTALNQPCESRSLDDNLLTGATGIFGAARHQNAELGRNDVELLADILANPMQAIAAAGAVMAFNVDDHIDARQMGGK